MWVQQNGLTLSTNAKAEPSDESAELKEGEKPTQAAQDEKATQQPLDKEEDKAPAPDTTEMDIPSIPE